MKRRLTGLCAFCLALGLSWQGVFAQDVLSAAPGDAMVVLYAPDVAAACRNVEAFTQSLDPIGAPGELLSKILERVPGDHEAGGLKTDGSTAMVVLSTGASSSAVLVEMTNYKGYIAGFDAGSVSKSADGFDQFLDASIPAASPTFMIEVADGVVAVSENEQTLRHVRDFAKQGVQSVQASLSAPTLASFKKNDLAVLVPVNVLRTTLGPQIMGAKMLIQSQMAMTSPDTTPAQKALMSSYVDWAFSVPEQVRSLVAGISVDAHGLAVTTHTEPEKGSTFASVLAGQTARSIPMERLIGDDVSLAMAWNMDYKALKPFVRDMMQLMLELSDPEPAPPAPDRPENEQQAYRDDLAERTQRHEGLLDRIDGTFDLMTGEGIALMGVNDEGSMTILEAIGATDAAAMKRSYDELMGETMDLMEKLVPGAEYSYEADAREVVGKKASVLNTKIDPLAASAGNPMMGAGMNPMLMGDGDSLFFAAGDNLVIAMNQSDEDIKGFVDSLSSPETEHAADGALAALLAKLPAKRNFVVVGSYSDVSAAALGADMSAAAPAAPGLALSGALSENALSTYMYLTVDEILRMKNVGAAAVMGGAARPMPQQGGQ